MVDASPARLVIADKIMLEACAPTTRFSFRGGAEAVAEMSTAFGVALPQESCRAAEAGSRAALWLGPDEWLLLAEDGDAPALGDTPHSLVDISHRQIGLSLSGPRAVELLAAGCPLDLDHRAFPIGMCTRTLLAKAEIVLWRRDPDLFRLELGRSFAAYAWDFLTEAAREFRADRSALSSRHYGKAQAT